MRKKGATLVLVTACIAVLCFAGLFILNAIKIIGGFRQVEHASSAGALNLAKEAIKSPGITLNPGAEFDNFGGLVDTNGQVDLLTYNRIVGQALLVALNAKTEGTPEAIANAKALIGMVQGGTNSIGGRLRTALSQDTNMEGSFNRLASQNSGRLLDFGGNIKRSANSLHVGYVEVDGPTNIYVNANDVSADDQALITGLASSENAADGQAYCKGYSPMTVRGVGTLYGVPVGANQQPHLISLSAFARGQNCTAATQIPATVCVPPNAFQIVGEKSVGSSGLKSKVTTAATIGTLNQGYRAEFTRGYIKIVNPRGYDGPRRLPNTNNIFNDELMSGIYLAADGTGKTVAFAQDKSKLQAWADYNNDTASPKTKPMPAFADSNGYSYVFKANGMPASTADDLKTLTAINSPASGCFASNTTGRNKTDNCAKKLGAFMRAYPHAPTALNGEPAQIMAVEKLKSLVLEAYQDCIDEGERLKDAGVLDRDGDDVANFQHAWSTFVADPSTISPHYSGLRLFNHTARYVASPVKFSTAGKVGQLLNQIAGGNQGKLERVATLMAQVRSRVRQIKPEATDADINALINSQTLDLQEVLYIYMPDPATRTLVCSHRPPSWVTSVVQADGQSMYVDSTAYPTLGTIANPPGELAVHDVLFYNMPDPGSNTAHDEVIWRRSSGYGNLLGTLEFRNYCGSLGGGLAGGGGGTGGGEFSDVN